MERVLAVINAVIFQDASNIISSVINEYSPRFDWKSFCLH